MKFDESKVWTAWDESMKGKHGWCSHYLNDRTKTCLYSYVEYEEKPDHYVVLTPSLFHNHSWEGGPTYVYIDEPDNNYTHSINNEFISDNFFIVEDFKTGKVSRGDYGFFADSLSSLINVVQRKSKLYYGKIVNIDSDTNKFIIASKTENNFLVPQYAPFFYRVSYLSENKKPWTNENVPDIVGKKVVLKNNKVERLVTGINKSDKGYEIELGKITLSYQELFDNYSIDNDNTCGE